jgi:hypothetical protein
MMKERNGMHIQNRQENPLYRAAQDQDPRELLSKLKIPDAQQHEEGIVTPLKRLKMPLEGETPSEDPT